ncbi:hypothetical protein [Actinocorallia longicatena]|uniref:Uncharacterized protein n=1 Tax=Actinocorallia longicatena TaxID=111803 RepID=A0ABP6QQZ3_9ACTN
MPRGAYVHLKSGREERFQCAPGPAGWRYVAEGVDLAVDSRWRPARLQLGAGERVIRGGALGRELLWVRDGVEHSAEALGFLGESPCFLVAVARSLGLEAGEFRDVPLVAFEGGSLAARTVRQRWTLVSVEEHATELGGLPVQQWAVTDLETAEQEEFHLAGDVVLAAEGIELASLESPPNL